MKNATLSKLNLLFAAVLTVTLSLGAAGAEHPGSGHTHDGDGSEASHDHGTGAEADGKPEAHVHEGGEEAHAETEAAHDHAPTVPVTRAQVKRLGIRISRAAAGSICREVRVPAEIRINSDIMAHVVPLAPGIVDRVTASLGQSVRKGQVLGVVRSRELAEAKAEYLASVERLSLAEEIYKREERLRKSGVSPEQDFVAARQALAEARIMKRSASQKLSTYGISPARLPKLSDEPEVDFASYEIIAPFNGTIIAKHIVLGEMLGADTKVFEVADLSSVWIDLAVSQDLIGLIRTGYPVFVRLPDGTELDSIIDYVSPVVAPETRSALARSVVSNHDGGLRPGTFADATITIPSSGEALVIPKSALQVVEDRDCVFVWTKAAFELRQVKTGVSDHKQIEVLSGLEEGEAVASSGAFHLKSELTKSDSDGCSGHGHSH